MELGFPEKRKNLPEKKIVFPEKKIVFPEKKKFTLNFLFYIE